MTKRKRSRPAGRDDPRNVPVILHQVGEEKGYPEWRRTTWYAHRGGAPVIVTEYHDNADDPGRAPAYRQTTTTPLADFLAAAGENDPAVATYRRLVAEGHIEPG